MKVNKWTAISAVLAALLALSLYGYYVFNQMTPIHSTYVSDLQYTQTANYTCTALVKPSAIYENRTHISTGEPLYIKLVEQLNIKLEYKATSNPLGDFTDTKLEYEVSGVLNGGDWNKTYPLGSETLTVTTFIDTYTLDIDNIQEMVETIGEETGSYAYGYTYAICPHITLEASAAGKHIQENFTPTLTMKFEGAQITFEGLNDKKDGFIAHTETEKATWSLFGWDLTVSTMRVTSMITSLCLTALLAVSLYFSFQKKTLNTFLERLSGDIRDKIIETSELPKRMGQQIKVNSIEDLAKVSEETFKPIIHHGDTFFVLDGNLRYEFTIEDTKKEKEIDEETADTPRKHKLFRIF
jgi:hypothetical protein